MRPNVAAAALLISTPIWTGLLLAAFHTSRAWAASECQDAFAQWAQQSEEQVQRAQVSGRGGCIASENARRDLLDGLARTRGLCGDPVDAGEQQTRQMLFINQSFISSLTLCRAESEGAGDAWAAKAAPERPKVAAPLPIAPPPPAVPPPAPITGGPRPSVVTPAAPKAVVAAPPAVAPKAPVSASGPTPPCLEVAAAHGGSFALVNRKCQGHTVLAVIETRAGAGESSCKGYAIGASLSVRAAGTPRVNYECLASQSSCNKDRLGDMFPECDW